MSEITKVGNEMKSLKVILILCIVILMAGSILGQSSVECNISTPSGGKYKKVFQARKPKFSDEVLLDVVINPKNFSNDYLTDFIKRIKRDYCLEKVVGVSIFENERDSIGWFSDFITSQGKIDRRRGTFVLDRTCGKENLEYSTARGRPIDEVKIDNSKIFGECRRH
jgi:hypothetical protein